MATAPVDSVDFEMDAHQWEHRLLFVFAPSADDAGLQAQRKALQGHAEGVQDRDLRLITVVEGAPSRIYGVPDGEGRPLTAGSVQRLRLDFDVAPDAFRVILVGKDGTEKRRDAEPVPVEALFAQIDAMPMRQREMRDGGGE